MIVLHKDHTRSTTNVILQTLAIWDCASLVLSMANNGIRHYINYWPRAQNYESIHPILSAILIYSVVPLQRSAQYGSTVMTVMVTIDRYLAVCKPLAVRTKTQVYITVASLCVYVLAFYIPSYFEYILPVYTGVFRDTFPEKDSFMNVTVIHIRDTMLNNIPYQILYTLILECLIRYITPTILLIVFNVQLYRALKRMQQRYLKMRRGSNLNDSRRHFSNSESLTLAIVIVVVAFVVLNAPTLIYIILITIRQQSIQSSPTKEDIIPFLGNINQRIYFITIANLLTSLAAAINFLIYVIFAKKFRRIFIQTFCSWLSNKPDKSLTTISSDHRGARHHSRIINGHSALAITSLTGKQNSNTVSPQTLSTADEAAEDASVT